MDYLIHYGVPRRSGRYKWGSGKNPRALRKAKRLSKKIDKWESQKSEAMLSSDRGIFARLDPSYYNRTNHKIRKLENRYDKVLPKVHEAKTDRRRQKLINKHNKTVNKLMLTKYKKQENLQKKIDKGKRKYKQMYKR